MKQRINGDRLILKKASREKPVPADMNTNRWDVRFAGTAMTIRGQDIGARIR